MNGMSASERTQWDASSFEPYKGVTERTYQTPLRKGYISVADAFEQFEKDKMASHWADYHIDDYRGDFYYSIIGMGQMSDIS